MRRLRISGQVIGSGISCCAAAILVIGLTALGHGIAGGSAHVMRASNGSYDQLLGAHAAPAAGNRASKSPSVAERYAQFPLSFEPNREQTNNAEVKFLARGEGYILFLTARDAVFSMNKAPYSSAVMRMSFLGANAKPSFTGLDELPGKSNYFIGNQPERWRTNIPNYRKVAEHSIYPGIDLIYYGTQRQLEYDFVIAPGASPSKIQIAFQGAKNLHTDADGNLVLSVAGSNDVRLHKPIAYQTIGTEKQLVAANFILKGKDRVEFGVGEYDASRPLIVDPILSYSTYLGGSGIDSSNSIAVAPDNTAFIAGSTWSSDFPTAHPLQANAGGNPDFPQDAFVSKISADGSTLLYSTYLGGNNRDAANGIAVDNFGNAYVTGYTWSPDFPVNVGSFNSLCGGDGECGATWNSLGLIVSNAFVTELNAAGSAIVYSGFLGYYEDVVGESIAVDGNGNAYVTGQTTANGVPTVTITPPAEPPPPFPISGNALQPCFGFPGVFPPSPCPSPVGSTNAFVTEIDATGTTLLYSSYLGGEIEDVGYGIVVDSSSNAYVTGLTYSTNFLTTSGALQAAYGGAGDAFVTKVNTAAASGSASLVYSTYLGGSGLDQGNAIAIDSSGNAYVAGLTNSASFGFTPAGYQPAYAGEGDAFVAKLTTTGALSYFTYLGGTHADSATGVAVDSSDNAYVTGTTASTDFPTAGAVFQPAYGGGNTDSFVAEIGPAGTTLVYSSYLGGTNAELSTGIAVDTSGSAYVTGQTCSEDFPLANPLQPVPGGNCDAYIAKVTILAGFALNPAGLVFSAQSLNTTSQSQTVTLTNGENPQTITSIAISGTNAADFTETTTCGSSLAVGGTCTITVSFTPSAPGIREASLIITDSAPGSPQVVNLTGNTSTVTLSSSSLSFGFQQVGIPSAAQAVTVTNSGTTALTISNISASGDFSETDDCTKTALQPSTNCVIQVTYTPSAAVASIGAVTLTDTGSGSPQVILATGTGVLEPQASLSPASFSFAGQPVGVASAPQAVTLSNTGDAPLSVPSIVATGDFSQSSTCGSILSANANCTISVTFTPTAAGTRTGTLTVTDNSGNVTGSTQTVQLSGIGLAVPVVSLSTSTLTFPGQAIGTTSAAQSVVLTNIGSAALTILNVTPSGDFAQLNNCPTSVAAGASCTINVTFTPTAASNRFGSVTITDNAVNSPQTISLSGIGNPTPQASLSVASLGFASQPIGVASAVQTMTLSNTGAAALSVSSIVATGDFSQSSTCGSILSANASCTINVTFTPTAAGTRTGTLTITDNTGNVAGSTQTVQLSGTGLAVPIASLSTNALTFNGQQFGTTSPAQSVTLTNTGSAPLIISNIASSGDFSQANNCPTSVAAGANCTFNITFSPSEPGNRFGSVTITDNAANSPQTITLSGVGSPTAVPSLSVASLVFGSQVLNTPSQAQVVTLSNNGNTTLAITSIVSTGDFAQSNNCGASLAAGAICSISVTFTPSVEGARTGSLTITDNAPVTTLSVSLTGTGAAFQISSTTPTPAVPAGQTATYALTISSLGGFSQQVALSCSGAPVAASCQVSPATVTPSATSPQTATLTVTTGLRTFAPPSSGIKIDPFAFLRHIGVTWLAWLMAILMLLTIGVLRRRPFAAAFGFAVVLMFALVACSGGSASGVPAGTPAGQYQITVTGVSGSVTSSTQFTLQVK